MSQWKIPLFDSNYGNEEIEAVTKVLQSGWLTMGEITHQFETQFCNYINVKHAFAVSNGTTALHLANVVLGISAGDEVIVPSLTFIASVNSILYIGATPIFADVVSEDDLTISPQDIERKISDKTKAILVVHYGGYPCQMEQIMSLARQYNLLVIEDAAHAPGAKLNGTSCGVFGDCGCFSFFSNKNLATGEGGMLVTNRDDLAERIKLIRSHGMTSLTFDRYKGHSYSYDVVDLGYNYRITEICAALGIVQLNKLDVNNRRRKELVEYYQHKLADLEGVKIPFIKHPGQSSYHIFPITLSPELDRNRFMEFLKQNGIQTSIHYPPVHRFTYHKKYLQPKHSLPVIEDIAKREVTLPLYPDLKFEEIDYIADVIKNFVTS
jgi:dTDP-4-amino-4,6-dideoxygalactose transaminase